MRQGVCIVSIIFFLASCRLGNERMVNISYKSDFLVDTAISVESYNNGQAIHPGQLLRLGDKLLITGDYETVCLYSYPDLRFLAEQQLPGYKGLTCAGDSLYAENQGKVDIYFVNNKDSLCRHSSFFIAKAPYSLGVWQHWEEDIYIYADSYDFRGKYEFHIMNTKPYHRESKGEYPEDDTRFKRLRDFKVAYMHSLKVKPDKSAFVVVYSQLRRIRIYDKEGCLKHDVFLDYPPGNYKVVPLEYEKRYYHFGVYAVTDKYIYLMNPDKLGQAPTEPHCNIIVMNWEGELVARYRLNVWINDFFVDEQKEALFGTCFYPSQGNIFFSLDLNKLIK